MLVKKFDIQLTQVQLNSFYTMSASFGDSRNLKSPGLADLWKYESRDPYVPRSQTATGLCFKMIMVTLGHTGKFQTHFQKTVLVLQLR